MYCVFWVILEILYSLLNLRLAMANLAAGDLYWGRCCRKPAGTSWRKSWCWGFLVRSVTQRHIRSLRWKFGFHLALVVPWRFTWAQHLVYSSALCWVFFSLGLIGAFLMGLGAPSPKSLLCSTDISAGSLKPATKYLCKHCFGCSISF